MTKLYLITGFLGSGKTTFLHKLVRLFPDRRLAIVVNEFGKVGVDEPPELIFVEASGLSDPTAVRSILAQSGKFASLDYAGAICLIDAARFQKVYQTARVCRMQLAVDELVLINK